MTRGRQDGMGEGPIFVSGWASLPVTSNTTRWSEAKPRWPPGGAAWVRVWDLGLPPNVPTLDELAMNRINSQQTPEYFR